MADADRVYCLQRAEEERERAETSDDSDIAERHSQMAKLYHLRATDPDAWSALSTQKNV